MSLIFQKTITTLYIKKKLNTLIILNRKINKLEKNIPFKKEKARKIS
jgi:hypothetical protein